MLQVPPHPKGHEGHAEEPRALGHVPLLSSNNGSVLFSFGIKSGNFCCLFLMLLLVFSNNKFCMEASLYLHYLKLGFLCTPKFCCSWHTTMSQAIAACTRRSKHCLWKMPCVLQDIHENKQSCAVNLPWICNLCIHHCERC